MSRARLLFLGIFAPLAPLAVILAVLAGPAACGTSGSSDTLAPITGIVVRAEALTNGYGCGPKATQIFRYLVVVFGANPADVASDAAVVRRDELLAASVYDCFADGQFVELPISGGSSQYALQVYVYNAAAYEAAGGDAAIKGIAARLTGLRSAVLNDPVGRGGPATADAIQAELSNLAKTNPTFSTTCDALQLPDVQSLAVCQPLSLGASAVGQQPAGPATVVLSTASFPGADGGVLTCDADYTAVRYRYGTGAALGATDEARCRQLTDAGLEPFVITVSPAAAPASYVFELELVLGDGTALGRTTCGAETSPGLTTSAVCAPVP